MAESENSIINFNDGWDRIKEIAERIEELKASAWDDTVEKTNVETPIKRSIISYIIQQENLQDPTEPITIYNPIIFKVNETLYTLNNKTLEDPNDEYTFDINKPGYIIQKDLETEVNTTDVAEEDILDEDFSTNSSENPAMAVATADKGIENYDIDQLKTEKANTENQIIEFNKEGWAKFVLNLLAFIRDFGPIHFETLYDGNFLLDENTDYGIKIISSDSNETGESNETDESNEMNKITVKFKDQSYDVIVNSVNYIIFNELDENINAVVDNFTEDDLNENNNYVDIDPTPSGENEG